MRALLLYETMFGDAGRVAEAVGSGLGAVWGPGSRVEVLEIGLAPTQVPMAVDLLVLGSPTHAFSLPRASTRQDAVQQTGRTVISARLGVREWLRLAAVPSGQAAAAFDTRMQHPRTLVKLDHASRQTEHGLRRLGARLVAPAEHFHVMDVTGPLADGEIARAIAWGGALAQRVAPTRAWDVREDPRPC
jgi:hypothetical protein